MTTNDIRQKFLDFFASKKHAIIRSDSLVPKNDPTVLFTTAGMQQFKEQFLGHIDQYTRAASSQKCLRTDDLGEVGKTDFHHTFFEMLGNFSFGDYFKKEAILFAWEFLTEQLSLPPERLWVSVYKDDSEAKDIWLNHIKIDAKKLVKLGDKSNFWPANAKEKGPNGPCGPCSEIFYDYGPNPKCTSKKCDPSCDCGRFSEVWNLVFTQYDRKEGGILEPLPNKNIDTGMGLERLAAVVQGKKSNYETDLFEPILAAIDKAIEGDNPFLEKAQKYIIADHIRSIVFAIADGVIPSNEGRGYVIKKLIISITDIVITQKGHTPTIHKLVDAVVEAMKHPYPELVEKAKAIRSTIRSIEEAYIKVYRERIPELEIEIVKAATPQDLGQVMFKFKDTYGLTTSTIEKIVMQVFEKKKKSSISLEGAYKMFDKLLAEQQEKSRAASKMTGDVFTQANLDLNVPKTEFVGYKHAQIMGTILKILVDGQGVPEATSGQAVSIILDKTPFYAESGGQVGDKGLLINGKGQVRIDDTQKIADVFVHQGTIENGTFHVNDQITAEIDIERRLSVMRNHTATHLLQAALRKVLGPHVQQQGSYVSEDRLRFDFTHPQAVTAQECEQIEKHVNEFIRQCDTVMREYLSIDEAQKSGALAFFAEKYDEVVSVLSIGDYSKEFCGGTHLDCTGQIGLFKIVGESAIAQGIRRLEAKTGRGALDYIFDQEKNLKELSNILKTPTSDLGERIKAMTQRIKKLEKNLEKYRFDAMKGSLETIVQTAEVLNGVKIISHCFKETDMNLLRKFSDAMKQKSKSAIIVLGAKTQDNASLLVTVSEDLIQKGLKANDIIQKIAPLINGSGGGRPQLAQAGSKEVDKIDGAIQQAHRLIKETCIK